MHYRGNVSFSGNSVFIASFGLLLMMTSAIGTLAQQPQLIDQSRAEKSTIADASRDGKITIAPIRKLIVIGFMGGNVSATSLVHREVQLINTLKHNYPDTVHAAAFANRDGSLALNTVLQLLGADRDGGLTDQDKGAARIVIYGHSWGASETVTLADQLNKLGIPVLLTVQVDSVQKADQNDQRIPPNVREAINFYQSEGLLRGRSHIVAVDPKRTKILANDESSYRQNPVSCAGYPWYARAFMKRHIQIENDPVLWQRIEAMILSKIV
jgi:hypothetical protein